MSASGFVEVADRCWVARQDFLDVNVSVVAGESGLVVVDTFASTELARGVLAEVRRLSAAPILAAVNTHAHFDHSFGNAVFSGAGAELVCHDAAAAEMPGHAESIKEQAHAEPDVPEHAGIVSTNVEVPGRTFSSALVLDLGDRQVELIHPGRGHTGGDLVVRIPDAEVLLAGDLVEESGDPGFGADCYPLDWPGSLDLVLGLIGAQTVVMPGHGAPVDRDFVHAQRDEIGTVAETIRHLAGRGVALDQVLSSAEWPFAADHLAEAVRRGYAQLPRVAKRLPLA